MSPKERPEALGDEGIPDLAGPLPEKAATGDPQEDAPPLDPETPIEAEVVEVDDDALGEAPLVESPNDAAGFELARPEDENVGLADEEKDETARRVEPGQLRLSPEEAALHLEGGSS